MHVGIDPGDMLLDFVLGVKWSRVNREKLANELVDPAALKPGPEGGFETAALPAGPGAAEAKGLGFQSPFGPTIPNAGLGQDTVTPPTPRLQELTGTQGAASVNFPHGEDASGVWHPGPAIGVERGVPAVGGDAKPLTEPSFLQRYGTPLAIGAGVAGAGALGGAGLAYYQHHQNEKKRKEEEALAAAGLGGEKLATFKGVVKAAFDLPSWEDVKAAPGQLWDSANAKARELGQSFGGGASAGAQQDLLGQHPYLPYLGLGAAAGAGLGLLGGAGSNRKKKDRFGDVVTGGLLGAGLGGLGYLGYKHLTGNQPTPPAGGGTTAPQQPAQTPAGPLSSNLVGGTGGPPALPGGQAIRNLVQDTGSPSQIANNLAAAGSRPAEDVHTLSRVTVPTVQRAEQLRDLAGRTGNHGAVSDLNAALDHFGRHKDTGNLAGQSLARLRETADRFGGGLPPAPDRSPVNVTADSPFYSAEQRRPGALSALVGGAAGAGGEAVARDARTDALSGLVGGPLSAGAVRPRTEAQDLADTAVSSQTNASPEVAGPRAEFQKLLARAGGNPGGVRTGTETDGPAFSSLRSPLGRTVGEVTGATMLARSGLGRLLQGDRTANAAGQLHTLLGNAQKKVDAPRPAPGAFGRLLNSAGVVGRGAGQVVNAFNPAAGLGGPGLPGSTAALANDTRLIDRLHAAAAARPELAGVGRNDVIAAMQGKTSGPLTQDHLRTLAEEVRNGHHARVPASVAAKPPAWYSAKGTLLPGAKAVGQNAMRSLPVGALAGVYRNRVPNLPSATTPSEDLFDLIGDPRLGRPGGLDPLRPGFAGDVGSAGSRAVGRPAGSFLAPVRPFGVGTTPQAPANAIPLGGTP